MKCIVCFSCSDWIWCAYGCRTDKRSHKKIFKSEIKYERFYRYLRYASLNTFMHLVPVFEDKTIELLEVGKEATDWFAGALTKMEGHWMLVHAGPGLSNTNCSSEVNWRIMKQALLGAAGKAGGGYNHLRTQSHLTTFV